MVGLYVATNGLSVWACDMLGDRISRMPSGTGMYSGSQVWALATHPKLPGQLFAGTDSGIYRLDRARNKWTHLPSPMDDRLVTAIALAPDDPRFMLAGTQPAGFFQSHDGGASWRSIAVPVKPYQDSGYYAGENSSAEVSEAVSDVKHWTRVTQIVFDPRNARDVWAGVEIDGAWRSRDGGESWERVSNGLETQDIHGFAVVHDGARKLFMTTPVGLHVSSDGGDTWRKLHLDSPWQYTRSVAERPDGTGVVFVTNGNGPPGSGGRLFRSDNYGRDWHDVQLPGEVESSAYFIGINPADANLVFVAAALGQIYRSLDGGRNWTALKRRLGEIRAIAWLPD